MPETENKKVHRVLPEEARDHLKAAGEEFRLGMEGLFPPGFIHHNRRARREFLLAARSLLDYALEQMEEPPKA